MKMVKNVVNLPVGILLMILITDIFAANESKDSLINLEKQVVTASRIPTALENTGRAITIITRDEIEHTPAQTISDLLEYVNGVDVRQRGGGGVQSDIHLRGGTFEQTLVLVDGIKMSDAQTGHHTMDLPLSITDIERIEVVPGAASHLYGPNAFGGVINIITHKGHEKAIRLSQTCGEYGFSSTALSLLAPLGASGNRISIQKSVSSGFRSGTEFDITGASIGSHLALEKTDQSIFAGFLDKPFGAYCFYSTKYPDEKEHTKTFFMNSSGRYALGRISLNHKLFWRRHSDDFILDRNNPSFYHNEHTTHSYGAEVQADIPSKAGMTALGLLGNEERISSTNLGDHARYYMGIFAEHQIQLFNRLNITAGVSSNYYEEWGWQVCPGADIGFIIAQPLRIYSSVGRSFRVPSYTELYYTSPANKGNPDLKPEKSVTIEVLGIKYSNKLLAANVTGFIRLGEDLIDWQKDAAGISWQANALDDTTYGVETGVSFFPQNFIKRVPIRKVSCNYSFLDSDKNKEDAVISKYIANHLRHQLRAEIMFNVLNYVDNTWYYRYEQRADETSHSIVDTRLNLKIWHAVLFLEVSNIFDVIYEDIGGIPMPGRWVKGGVNISLTKPAKPETFE